MSYAERGQNCRYRLPVFQRLHDIRCSLANFVAKGNHTDDYAVVDDVNSRLAVYFALANVVGDSRGYRDIPFVEQRPISDDDAVSVVSCDDSPVGSVYSTPDKACMPDTEDAISITDSASLAPFVPDLQSEQNNR